MLLEPTPHLRLIVVDLSARNNVNDKDIWKDIFSFAKQGHDVCLINATFSNFCEMIPNLRALTPSTEIKYGNQEYCRRVMTSTKLNLNNLFHQGLLRPELFIGMLISIFPEFCSL